MPKIRSLEADVIAAQTPTDGAAIPALVRIVATALLAGWPSVLTIATASAASIIEVEDSVELQATFCAADPAVEHILVLPASLFVDSDELLCPAGPYKLYRIIEHDDQDDFEYYVDPPFGAKGRLACDGKAGRGMKVVAVNCRPVG